MQYMICSYSRKSELAKTLLGSLNWTSAKAKGNLDDIKQDNN